MNRKLLLIVSLLLLGLASGCKDIPSGPPNDFALAGKIESWQSDGNDNLYLTVLKLSSRFVLDSVTIAVDGGFLVKIPFPVPPDSVLRQFVAQQDSNEHLFTRDKRLFSNANVKYVDLSMLVFDRHHLSRFLYSGNTFASSDSLAAIGDYRVAYYYFSEATTISGQYQLTFYDSVLICQYGHSSFITDYSMNVAEGWNAVTTRVISDAGQTRTYQISAGDVPEKKWFAVWFISRSFEFASTL